MAFGVANFKICFLTSSGEYVRSELPKSRATTPATCGVAIDVPLNATRPFGFLLDEERISSPGAFIVTHFPKFEK